MTATPLPPTRASRDVDIAPLTVLALTWLAALVATSLTLWILVGVVGSS